MFASHTVILCKHYLYASVILYSTLSLEEIKKAYTLVVVLRCTIAFEILHFIQTVRDKSRIRRKNHNVTHQIEDTASDGYVFELEK